MSNAQLIYEQITNEESIQSFFTESENLFFDFKEIRTWPDEGFRKILSKAISGFSNADGGVLIVGVKEIATAFELAPSEHYQAIQPFVQQQISRVTEPPNSKVVAKTIPSTTDAGKGFVIILIPRSDVAPHQDVLTRKYYQRAGDSHKDMFHFQIADLFGRRATPNLKVVGVLSKDVNADQTLQLEIFLENQGKAIAQFPFIQITSIGKFNKHPHYTSWFRDPIYSKSSDFYSTDINQVIHSETRRPAQLYKASLGSFSDTPIEIQGRYGCEHCSTLPFSLKVSSRDVDTVYGTKEPKNIYAE